MNYYNDNDPKACAWIQELIQSGLIPQGVVDDRSISEVHPKDIKGYTQCHFFAGIAGWPLALQRAGWPADRPVWSGSCPCQPFSAAGKQKAQADERHLWPEFMRLIRECRPDCVIGEQVEGAVRLGWLDGVCADLEGAGYACGTVVLGAHSAGAPHIRQRLFWVGHAEGHDERRHSMPGTHGEGVALGGSSSPCRMADAEHQLPRTGDQRLEGCAGERRDRPAIDGHPRGLGHPDDAGLEGRGLLDCGCARERTAGPSGHWDRFDLIPCGDGKQRRIEPGSAPLAHGVPARVVRLRGYGNAICVPTAQAFVEAYMNVKHHLSV